MRRVWIDYLRTYFRAAEPFPARGEATVSYYHLGEKVIPRMRAAFPGDSLRFVVVLREPVGRVWSWHLQHRIDTRRPRPIEALLERAPVADAASMRPGVLRANLAGAHLRRWMDAFGPSNVRVLLTEDLAGPGASATIAGLFEFLGVEATVPVGPVPRINSAKRLRWPHLAPLLRTSTWQRLPLDVDVRRRLYVGLLQRLWEDDPDPPRCPPALATRIRAFYAQDTRALAESIDRDLSHWLGPDPGSDGARSPEATPPQP